MQTHDIGKIFVHPIRLKKKSSIVHRAKTHEIEPPYRVSHSWVFRIWGEWGFVLGYWRNQKLDEEDALLSALNGHQSLILDRTGHILDRFEPERGTDETRDPISGNISDTRTASIGKK